MRYGAPFRIHSFTDAAGRLVQRASREEAEKAQAERGRHPERGEIAESRYWYAYGYLEGNPRGRRIRLPKEVTTKYEAKLWTEQARGKSLGPAKLKKLTLQQACESWLEYCEQKGRSSSTMVLYRERVERWLAVLGPERQVRGLAPEDVAALLKARRLTTPRRLKNGKLSTREPRKVAPRTYNLELQVFKAFCSWAVRSHCLQQNPVCGEDRQEELRRDPVTFAEDEIPRILAACRRPYQLDVKREDFRPYEGALDLRPPGYLYPFCVAALTTLLRKRALLSIRWQDIDMVRGEIRVPPELMKTKQEHVMPLPATLAAALLEVPKGKPGDRVFDGAGEVYRAFVAARKRAGVGRGSLHAWRRTGATVLRRRGVGIDVVRALGGWSTGKDVLLTFYRNVGQDELRAAMGILDEIVRRTEGVELARPTAPCRSAPEPTIAVTPPAQAV